MKTLIIILLLLSSSAHADEWKNYFVVNMSAYHFNREATKQLNFNEINPGVGIEFNKKDYGFAIGSYYNSLRKNSNYLLASYTPVKINNVSIGLIAGGITGYPMADIIPALGLLATVNFKSIGANIIITPDVPELNIFGFIGLQAKYNFN